MDVAAAPDVRGRPVGQPPGAAGPVRLGAGRACSLPPTGRLVLNILLLAAESLPGGGLIALSGSPASDVLVTIDGPRAAWPPGFAACLTDETAAWEALTARAFAGAADRPDGPPSMAAALDADAGRAPAPAHAAPPLLLVAPRRSDLTANRRRGLPFLRQRRPGWAPPAMSPGQRGPAMDDLLADFLTETNESLAELDVALVKLERTPDDGETLSLIFRLVHTIKGTCGFLGLPRLERVAHAAENVLGQVRDGALAVDAGHRQPDPGGARPDQGDPRRPGRHRQPNRRATTRR